MDAGWRRADADDEAEAQADRREVPVRDRGAVRGLTGEDFSPLEAGNAVWAAFNSGDLDALWALLHPDCVVATDSRWPGGGEFHGVEEFQRFMGGFLEALDDVRFDLVREPEMIGDWLHYRGKWLARGHSSGIETVSFEFSQISIWEDGLIRESRFFFDEDEAREHAQSRT